MIEYKRRVEEALKNTSLGTSKLAQACMYSLSGGGKRIRPILTLMIADAIGDLDAMPSALGAEFFHTASLIADDLPCMDNDGLRRGKAALHVAFDETTAILASYTLIASGYGSIYENGNVLRKNPHFSSSADKRAMECLRAATECAKNATEGQYFDLYPPSLDFGTICDVIYKKTVTLFEISFLFGWLFGGGDLARVALLKKCAYHFGMAFQVADDLEDGDQDSGDPGVNMASVLGKEQAILFFDKEMELLESRLKELRLWTQPFQEIYENLLRRGHLFSRGTLFRA